MKLSTEKIQNLPYVRIGKKSQVFFLFFIRAPGTASDE